MRVALNLEWYTPSPFGVCSLCGSDVCQNNFSPAMRNHWRSLRRESRIRRMAKLGQLPIKYEMRSYSPFPS